MITVAATHVPADPALSPSKGFSWHVGGLVLIAFTAFAVFHHDVVMPLPLGLLFALPWLIDFRKRTLPVWVQIVLRLQLFAAVALYSRYISADFRGVFVYPGWVQLFTRLCMVEVTLIHFGFAPYRKSSQAVPAAILMSALVFAAASKTVDVEAIFIYFAIPWFVCLAASLRGVRPRYATPNLPWIVPKMWMHLAALFLALMAGVAFARYVGSHKRQLAPYFRAGPFLAQTQAQQATNVGFNDAPVLGSTQNMTRSLERVLSVQGRIPDPHLRGLVFEIYSAGRWLPQTAPHTIDPGKLAGNRGDLTEVVRLSDYIPVMFVPLHSSGVSCERPELLECDTEHGNSLHAYASAPFHYTFRFSAAEPDLQGPLCTELSREHLRACLAVPPEIDVRVTWLAKDITRGCKTDLERLRAIEGWLRSNIKYSLRTTVGRGDPVTEFLITRRAAHCEFFASAATLLLRCVGVPSRYVTGFYAHEQEGVEKYIVRQQDSHAWSEAWIKGAGWLTVEATPSSGMPEGLGEKPQALRSISEWFADIYFEVLHWIRGRTLMQWICLGAAVLAATIGILVLRRRRLRAVQSTAFQYSALDPQSAAMAARFDRFLTRRRIPCPVYTTWQEHFEMLAAADASIRFGVDVPRCLEFVRNYSALRFGADRELRLVELARELAAIERS